MYLFLFLNKIMFGNSILDGLFNIPQYESKRKPMFNDLDSIFKKEENTRPSIYKKDEIKGSAKKDIKQELPKKNMFEPKCGNSLTTLRDEYNKYNEFIYKNEVLIEQLKEENESAKKIQEQLSKKIKELEQDVTAIIKEFADSYVKKGGLKLKSPITNAFISQRIIFLFTKETLLLFDMISLSFIKSISNLYYHKNAITYSINSNNTIAYVSNEAINTVRIRQIEIEENKKISVRKDDIETNFSFIQALKMSSNFKYIAVFTFNGNKMHIYDIQTKFLSMCFYLGNEISTIRQINFDIKEKFILIIHEIEEQGKLTLIKLNAEKKKCSCKEHDDNDLLEKTNDKEEKNFISLWFDGFKDKFKEVFSMNKTGELPKSEESKENFEEIK